MALWLIDWSWSSELFVQCSFITVVIWEKQLFPRVIASVTQWSAAISSTDEFHLLKLLVFNRNTFCMTPNRKYYVYILTNKGHRVLYTGVTGNIAERLEQHRTGEGSEFSARYKTHKLVYLETFGEINQAIDWEKTIKAGSRKRKDALINDQNPEWRDQGDLL